MAAYWLLMFYAPVPGYGACDLDVDGNFAHYIDRMVLGSHNYRWTRTGDPAGVLFNHIARHRYLPARGTCRSYRGLATQSRGNVCVRLMLGWGAKSC